MAAAVQPESPSSPAKRSHDTAFTTFPPSTDTITNVAGASLTSSSNGGEPAAKRRKIEPLSINGAVPKKPLTEEERNGKISMIARMKNIVSTADTDSEKLQSEQMIYKLAFEIEQSDNQTLRSEADALNGQVTVLQHKATALTDQLRTANDTHATSLQETANQIQALEKQFNEHKCEDSKPLQTENTKLKKEIDRLNKELTDSKDVINGFRDTDRKVAQTEMMKLKEQITSLETHNRNMDKQLKQIKKENSELTVERNGAKAALQKEELVTEKAIQNNQTLQKKMGELKAAYKKQLDEKEALHKKELDEKEALHNKQLKHKTDAIAKKLHEFADLINGSNKTQ